MYSEEIYLILGSFEIESQNSIGVRIIKNNLIKPVDQVNFGDKYSKIFILSNKINLVVDIICQIVNIVPFIYCFSELKSFEIKQIHEFLKFRGGVNCGVDTYIFGKKQYKFVKFSFKKNIVHDPRSKKKTSTQEYSKSKEYYQIPLSVKKINTKEYHTSNQITFEQLKKEVKNKKFISDLKNSRISLMSSKVKFYENLIETTKGIIEDEERKINRMGFNFDNQAVKDIFPLHNFYKAHVVDIEDLISKINNIQHDEETIKSNLESALYNPLKGLNTIVGRIEIKNMIASQLYAFSKNHKSFLNFFSGIALMGNAGVGKCLGIDTPVLMFDGSIKKVQDIFQGELLMGDDSSSRTVLSVTTGKDILYEICPGESESKPHVVNKDHIICIKRSYNYTLSENGKNVKWVDEKSIFHTKFFGSRRNSEDYIVNKRFNSEITRNINIEDYFYTSCAFKKVWKLYRTGVDFPYQNISMDPYILGLVLGRDYNILRRLEENDSFMDHNLESCITNDMIPNNYKINSHDIRSLVLSGIIDSINNGLRNEKINEVSYKIYPANEKLASEIIFLARSLGINTQLFLDRPRIYIILLGCDLRDLPIATEELKINTLDLTDHSILSNVKINKLKDVGDYFGFTIDGNSRFLLGDFIVTHNTKLATTLGYFYSKSGMLANEEVIIATKTDIVGSYIGQTGPKTRKLCMNSLEKVLFFDEAHQIGSPENIKDYGSEAISELVNFWDKYIGMSVPIVGGYKKQMRDHFFKCNEGLDRRFPNQIELENYSESELTDILISFINLSAPHIKLDDYVKNFLFTIIIHLVDKHSDVFKNQAGDILNLSSFIIRSIEGSYNIKWEENNLYVITEGINCYLSSKKLPAIFVERH